MKLPEEREKKKKLKGYMVLFVLIRLQMTLFSVLQSFTRSLLPAQTVTRVCVCVFEVAL